MCIALAVSACGAVARPSCPPPRTGDTAYVVGQGWHVEIGIPVAELDENMSIFREIFPGAQVIMFGYGKKTFFIAPAATVNEYLLGPFPGPAAIQVIGLNVMPPEAYPPEDTLILRLPPQGSHALSAYIWKDIVKDTTGKPQMLAPSNQPNGLFYAAQSEYTLFHTCNTWIADALHNAGLPVSGDNVIFSRQVMTRVVEAAKIQCQALR
jgi:hypothetical protein